MKTLMEDMVEQQERVLSALKSKRDLINDVANAVCFRFEITVSELSKHSRKRQIVNARVAFCHLIAEQNRYKYSLNEIGNMLDLHHATIINCIRNGKNWIETDKDFSKRVKLAKMDVSHLFVKLDVNQKLSAVNVVIDLRERVKTWLDANAANPFVGYMQTLHAELQMHKDNLAHE